jgi:hypothetical protein
MALDPEDAIPAAFLPEPAAPPEEEKAAELSSKAFAALVGVPLIAGAGWLEWNNFHAWWVSAVLLSGFGFVSSGYMRGKLADIPIVGLLMCGLGLYVYGVVTAESVSLRIWLGLWLFGAFVLFGNALPTSKVTSKGPAPQQEPQDRDPELP